MTPGDAIEVSGAAAVHAVAGWNSRVVKHVIAQFAHLGARPIDRDNVRSRKLATPLDSCFLPVDLPMPGQIRLSTA